MSLHDLVLAVRRHRVLFLVCVLVTVAVGAYAAYSAPRRYTARIQLFVSSTDGQSIDDLLQNSSLAQQRVPSYTALVNSPLVADAVIARLGLAGSPESVAAKIKASNPLDVALIDVTVQDDTARGAYDLANAVGEVFGPLVGRIEAPAGGRSPVKITVIRPPVLPDRPTGTGPVPYLALSAFLALNLGAIAALVRDRMDDRLHDAEELRSAHGVRPVATIAVDARAPAPADREDAWPSAAAAEGFRTLRTNLQALVSSDDLHSVLVTGPLSGEGSSAVARDLAMALGVTHARVLLVEANLRDGGAGEQWGIDERFGLSQVLADDLDVWDVIQPWNNATIDVLPAGPPPPNPSELLASQAMQDLIGKLEYRYDLVVVDAPGVLRVTDPAVIATRTDGTILTVWLGRTRRESARHAIRTLTDLGVRVLGTVAVSGRSRRAERWRKLRIDRVPPGAPRPPETLRASSPVPDAAGPPDEAQMSIEPFRPAGTLIAARLDAGDAATGPSGPASSAARTTPAQRIPGDTNGRVLHPARGVASVDEPPSAPPPPRPANG